MPSAITLRGDALQVARFEALVEKLRRMRRAPAGADRLDLVLSGLEALLQAEDAAPAATDWRPGVPTVQVVVQQCPACAAAAVVTQRGELPLAPAQVAALGCDARVQVPGKPNRATIPPRTRAAVLARDRYRCTAPGCGSVRFLEVHHVTPRRVGGSNRAGNLVTLCSRCHAHAHAHPQEPAQAQDAQVTPGGIEVAALGRAQHPRPRAG